MFNTLCKKNKTKSGSASPFNRGVVASILGVSEEKVELPS